MGPRPIRAGRPTLVVGIDDGKDGEGARRLGIPFVRVTPEDTDGDALLGLAREMGGSWR